MKESKAGKILFLLKLQADLGATEKVVLHSTFYSTFMFLYFSFRKEDAYSEQQFILSVVSLCNYVQQHFHESMTFHNDIIRGLGLFKLFLTLCHTALDI